VGGEGGGKSGKECEGEGARGWSRPAWGGGGGGGCGAGAGGEGGGDARGGKNCEENGGNSCAKESGVEVCGSACARRESVGGPKRRWKGARDGVHGDVGGGRFPPGGKKSDKNVVGNRKKVQKHGSRWGGHKKRTVENRTRQYT